MSADGRQLAFTAINEGQSQFSLWVHPLDSPVARVLAGTEGAHYPFWSPDGRFLAFFADGKLKKVNVNGGPPVSLCDARFGKSGTWKRPGKRIGLKGATMSAVRRISAALTETSSTGKRLEFTLGDGSARIALSSFGGTIQLVRP